MSKHDSLWNYLKNNKKELKEYGYEIKKISLKGKRVELKKIDNIL